MCHERDIEICHEPGSISPDADNYCHHKCRLTLLGASSNDFEGISRHLSQGIGYMIHVRISIGTQYSGAHVCSHLPTQSENGEVRQVKLDDLKFRIFPLMRM